MTKTAAYRLVQILMLAAMASLPPGSPALAADEKAAIPSTEEIVQRLTTPPDQLPITMRGITIVKRNAEPASRPAVDLAINFEFNSARLTPDGEQLLDNLGRALTDPQLVSSRFAIAGHTDGVGSAGYNKTLSRQRAESVRHYLMERYGLAGKRLTAAGYGLTQLLDPDHPASAVNRRVEITNIGRVR